MEGDADHPIVTQLGLLLTQLRRTREAVESIERSTAAYTGLNFTVAISQSSSVTAPPMLNGALKVYIVNLRDLTSGGLGEFIEGLFGGIGRLVGGFIGGVTGGLVGGILTPFYLGRIERLVRSIETILTIVRSPPGGGGGESGGPSTLPQLLERVTVTINALTALFESTNQEPDAASGLPTVEQGRVYLAIFELARQIVNGLILLVPLVIGALASLLARLDFAKAAVLDLLAFALRNVFLLRGALLVTLYDTFASVARLAASLLRTLRSSLDAVLNHLFTGLAAFLDGALRLFQTVSTGLQRAMNALLDWLVTGLGNALIFLGDTRLFRLLYLLVERLPAILPVIYRLLTIDSANPAGRALPGAEARALRRAAAISIPPMVGGFTGARGRITPFPDAMRLALPPISELLLRMQLRGARDTLTDQLRQASTAAIDGLDEMGRTLSTAATTGETDFVDRLRARAGTLNAQAAQLTESLLTAQRAAEAEAERRRREGSGPGGWQAIASAYEAWLRGGGMNAILTALTQHFATGPASGSEAASSLPGRAAGAAGTEVRGGADTATTIEIGEMVIEITPPPAPAPGGIGSGGARSSLEGQGIWMLEEMRRALHELEERGYRPDPLEALA